jgi:hypothetical protein
MTIDGATLDALLTVTTTSGAVSVAKASDIELNWRMMAIVDCLAERPGTINQQILTVLVQDQQLAASAMRYLCGVFAVSTINTLMFRASSSQASILFEVASQAKIGPDGLAVVLLAYLSRDDISDSHGKLQFLNQWLASHDKVKTHPGVTATYCSWLADACLQHSLWVRAQDLPLLQNVADMARASALADSWKELLTVAARIDRPRDLYHYRHDLNAIVDRMPRDKHQEAAVELIADTLVGNCQNELDIDAIYNWKQSWTSLPLNRVARELLIAAARQSVTGSAELAALRWIVSRVQEGMLATQRTGRLSRTVELVDQELQTTVKDVFQRHSARIATALAMYALEQQGGVAAKWWPTIDPEASSRHQPTVQPGKKH